MAEFWRRGTGWLGGLAAAVLLLNASPAMAAPLPPGVAGMIDAAASDPATLSTVVKVAKKANPGSTAEIDALVTVSTARAETAKTQRLATQRYYEGWDGKIQLGAYSHTGNTKDGGVATGLYLNKDGQDWRHSFIVLADYQQENGAPTKQKYSAAYEGDYKVGKKFYAYGVLYAEQDIFAGVESRYSESLGVGYRFVDKKTLKFSLEGGPALRQTTYIGAPYADTTDLRLAGDFAWTIWPGVVFTQTAWTYLESRNPTITTSTALSTSILRGVASRFSFDVSYEGSPPPGRETTDTTSRVTLIYNF